MSIARGRSAPPSSPTRATHGRCVLCHLCRGVVARCAQVCTVVFRLCTVCTVCRNVVGPDGGFQRVFCEVCAHLQNVSDSVAELDAPREQVDGSEICARVRKKTAPGQDFSPWSKSETGAKSGSFFRPGPSGGGFGRIWPNLAPPAAILINAYSGDFCHPVLSNALAQEPLVYHSGTRELFSGHFRTFSEISTFSSFLQKTLKFANSVKNCEKTDLHVRACLQK